MRAPQVLITKLEKLKSDRSLFETVWQEINELILPRKDDVINLRVPGEKKYADVLDSTGMTSCELLAGTLHGMLTNPAGYFFGMSTGDVELDQNDNVRKWVQQVVRIMHDTLNNSNFQTEVHEIYLDLVAIGTACMLTEEDNETDARFMAHPMRDIYIDENSKGKVDSVYHPYKMDARGLVDDFGLENLPEKIQVAYKKGSPELFEMLHVVYPKPKAGVTIPNNLKKFKYISQYIWVTEKKDIEVKGFYELPFQVPRWSKASGEKYGRGCGEKALPSVKTACKMRETVLRGAQKTIDPPLQAPDDGFLGKIVSKPAGINYYRAGTQDRIQPILNDARIDYGFQAIDQERLQIKEAFYTDQLKLGAGPQMTATEVNERVEQALRFLGPMLGRLQSEFLQPVIERLYNILDRKGKLPKVPAELRGVPLNVSYTSVIAMQQRMSEINNIRRTMQEIAPFASADPSTLDVFNGTRAAKYIAKVLNFPQEIINNADEIGAIREDRAKAQQAAMQTEQNTAEADQVGKVVGAAAKLKPVG